MRPSLRSLGLPAIVTASTLWAIAANVASSLFQTGVPSFDLAGVTTMITTLVLLLVQTVHQGLPSLSLHRVQFVLGALFTFVPSDFQEPDLRAVFGFIDFTDMQFINANGLRTNLRDQSLMEANAAIQDLASHW